MGFLTSDAFAGHGTGNKAILVAMCSKENIARSIEIESHGPPERLADFLLAAWRALRDAMRIRKVRAATVNTNNTKALRPVLGHDDFEVVNAAAYLHDIFGMALK
jgi:hypothetical protein